MWDGFNEEVRAGSCEALIEFHVLWVEFATSEAFLSFEVVRMKALTYCYICYESFYACQFEGCERLDVGVLKEVRS